MTLTELLNSEMDFGAASALARQGLAWWLDELRGMLPARWRDRLSTGPRVWIEPRPKGGWRLWKDGRAIDGPRSAALGKIGLLLPSDQVLVRDIVAPRMAAGDLRRMLSLDIDRLSPLNPELIHFDLEIAGRGESEGASSVKLAIVTRAAAAALLTRARAEGLSPVAMAVGNDADPRRPRFTFLAQPLRDMGEETGDPRRRRGWAAAGALIVLNLAVLVGRDIISVSRAQSAVDVQRPVVEAVTRLRRRVEAEDARRRDWLARGRRADPLRMLNSLTQALPSGASVQHLEWNGETLHIIGLSRTNIDLAAAIRGSGAFSNPRAVSEAATSAPIAGQGSSRPFDITADARPDSAP